VIVHVTDAHRARRARHAQVSHAAGPEFAIRPREAREPAPPEGAEATPPLRVVVCAIQSALSRAEFDWFYPNDFVLIARNQRERTDVVVMIEHGDPPDLRVSAHFTHGSDVLFLALTGDVRRAVAEMSER